MATESESERIVRLLQNVVDPELPMLNIVEMGIVRDVETGPAGTVVQVTPTYSGCPAMHVIEEDIKRTLEGNGYGSVSINRRYSPPWSTDWITESARRKLLEAGIAPPSSVDELHRDFGALADRLVSMPAGRKPPPCPRCGSHNTALTSEYGATSCKALCVCHHCKEPFEHFKEF